jgi:spermidine synthase
VYLITFIVTFGGTYPRFASTMVLILGAAAALLATKYTAEMPILLQIAAFLVLLAGACMICHGELVVARPAAVNLTSFYLAISVGGVLGGAFVALAAPRMFTSFTELPIFVLVALMVAVLPASRLAAGPSRHRVTLALCWLLPAIALGASIPLLPGVQTDDGELVESRRDFFGVLRVRDHDPNSLDPWRGLYHGRVLHGAQFARPDMRRTPTIYYGDGSGVALAFEQHSRRLAGLPMKAGIVGLGTGTLAAFGREGDELVFFELNPNVTDIARKSFSFLGDSRAHTSVVPGDARLSLERELAHELDRAPYDLIVIDAFAGDSVPVHLLTRECFALYARALAPGGVVVVHVSNRHIDLSAPVHGLATWAGLSAVELFFDGRSAPLGGRSDWILVSGDAEFLKRAIAGGASPLEGSSSVLWTDDYSSILHLLR